MNVSRIHPVKAGIAASVVVAAVVIGFGQSSHAYADSTVPASPSPFSWQLHLPDGINEGGIAPDLQTAISDAEMDLNLSSADQNYVVTTLTAEAAAGGATVPAADSSQSDNSQ